MLPKLSVLLLAFVLLVSCDGTVYHRFGQVDSSGWALHDTVQFVYEGSSLVPVGSEMEYAIQVRYDANYKYKDLYVRVETWNACDTALVSVDTLCCYIYDDNGRRLGYTAGTMYQNESMTMPLAASCTDTLLLRVSHIMDDDSLQGVFDVGMRLAARRE